MMGEERQGRRGYDLRPREGSEQDMGEDGEANMSEASTVGEAAESAVGGSTTGDQSSAVLLEALMGLMKESREERKRADEMRNEDRKRADDLRRDDLKRAEALEKLRLEAEERRLAADQRRWEEDRERERRTRETEKEWRERQSREKRESEKLQQALRTFPKISVAHLLPAQLGHFATLMETHGVDSKGKVERLPEVLSGAMALAFHNMPSVEGATFEEVRQKLLSAAGLTEVSAGREFMRPDLEPLAKQGAVEVCSVVRGLVDRILATTSPSTEIKSTLLALFLNVNGTHNMITALAGVDNTSMKEVTEAACRVFETFGSILKVEGRGSRRNDSGTSGRGNERGKCFTCGKSGHKAVDCRVKDRESKSDQVTCFNCQEKGHYSSSCPKRSNLNLNTSGKGKGENIKDIKKTNAVEIEVEGAEDHVDVEENCMLVEVEGKKVKVLIDSGAGITVLPNSCVPERCYTGEDIKIRDWEGRNDRRRPVAIVKMKVGKRVVKERVAVSEQQEGNGLLKLNCNDKDRMSIVFTEFYTQRQATKVGAVQTRALRKRELEEEAEIEKQIASESIELHESVHVESQEETEPEQNSGLGVEAEEDTQQDEMPVIEQTVNEEVNKGVDIELDHVSEGEDSEKFRKEVKEDETLETYRTLANQEERGYRWEQRVLTHTLVDPVHGEVKRIVLPVTRRESVMRLAHDRLGHLGHRKVKRVVDKRFVWPGMGVDIERHCASCEVCQRAARGGPRRAPMVERPILTEPFESIAIDLVGPLPVSKGKMRYLLTAVCLATRWPEVIPLKNITARAVADGLVEIFGRTGLPLVILSDNGTQFTGKLMKELLALLDIEIKHTTPYHPQCNGVVERMHATIEGMLRKATQSGGDWVGQLPFVLFALRQMPSSSTGFSPYELVWGRVMRTPIDIVYSGWLSSDHKKMNVSDWAERLGEKLETMRDWAVSKNVTERQKRKEVYDRGKCVRMFEEGDKVWVRIPGRSSKLEDAWEGPYLIVKRLNTVNYRVKREGSKKARVIHINSVKKYVERAQVAAVAVIAEESGDDLSRRSAVVGEEVCGRALRDVEVVLKDFEGILDGHVGRYTEEQARIDIEPDAVPIARKAYRIPDSVKEGVRSAIEQLVNEGWAEEAESVWASPIVPVVKRDGSVRLCVNYRGVNAVTRQLHHPIPHFDDLMGKVGDAKVVSKLDLAKGYYQVGLEEESRDITAFVSPWGTYRFRVLPFGLKNAPAIFQRIMTKVLKDCQDVAIVYIDDILIYSREVEEHASDVRRVLSTIEGKGLTLNRKKCCWARKRVEFLGHVIGEGRLSVPEARVESMKKFVKPRTRRDMRAFLGTIGYYRRFIPKFADLSFSLNPSTSCNAPRKIEWTPEMEMDFERLCKSLCNVCVLHVPIEGDCFCVHTDASGKGISGILYVVRGAAKLPVAFYSKPLQGAERRYSATEIEALAIMRSVEHFLPYLYGRSFRVVTDHAPLQYLMTAKNLNRRLRGWMVKLSEFDLAIEYRPGVDNADADGLSRQAWSSVDVPDEMPLVPQLSWGGCEDAHQSREEREEKKEQNTSS